MSAHASRLGMPVYGAFLFRFEAFGEPVDVGEVAFALALFGEVTDAPIGVCAACCAPNPWMGSVTCYPYAFFI